MRVTARGPGGHASVPRTGSAVFTLAEALLRLRAFAPESVLQPASRRMLATLAQLYPGPGAEAIGQLLKDPTWDRTNSLPIDPVLREFVVAGLHNTATPTVLSAGQRQNVVPVEADVVLDGRLLPGELPDRWAAAVQQALGDRVEVSLLHGRVSRALPRRPGTPAGPGRDRRGPRTGRAAAAVRQSGRHGRPRPPRHEGRRFLPLRERRGRHAAHPRTGRARPDHRPDVRREMPARRGPQTLHVKGAHPMGVVIETLTGKVEGTAEDGLSVFKGIPYALPRKGPSGSGRRFRSPPGTVSVRPRPSAPHRRSCRWFPACPRPGGHRTAWTASP